MRRKETKYIKIAKTLWKVLTKTRVPLYLNTFSNHIYTVWQHIVFLTIKEYANCSYRRLMELLEECTALLDFLGLDKVPHFTTLHKFAMRFKTTRLEKVLGGFILLTRVGKLQAGMDSTGYAPTRASHYYVKTLRRRPKKKKSRRKTHRKVRKHVKVTAVVEVRKQLPVSLKIRRGPANDCPDFEPALEKASRVKPVGSIVADKGYDSEANHEFARDVLGGESIIPPRNEDVPVWRTKGKYRKKMKRGYSKKKYGKRNMNETMHSVIKRLFGDGVRSTKVVMQNREIYWRHIAYGAHRIIGLFLWILEGFY